MSIEGLEAPYLYRGVVESNEDPKKLGRCRVRVFSVHGELDYPVRLLPWARPLVLAPTSQGKGSVNIPAVGDIVWVMFEGGNRDFPIYLGGTYAVGELDIDTNRVDFYIEEDTKISYNKKDKVYSIKIGDNISLLITTKGVTVATGGTSLVVTSSGVEVQGNLKITGDLIIEGTCNKECDC